MFRIGVRVNFGTLMHFRLLLSLGLVCIGLLSSCKKESDPQPTVNPQASMRITVSNEVSGQPVNLGPISYKNAAGNDYSIDLLKYYLSNFTLIRKDKSELKLNQYVLINANDSATWNIKLDSVLNGDYEALRFCVGVDSARNHTGLQDGALDPVNGMIWTWKTGYIFFKHEGNFKDASGGTTQLVYHLGTDWALPTVTVPLDMKMNGSDISYKLHFDLNKVYNGTGGIPDFNDENVRMSDPNTDLSWMVMMKSNFMQAFTLTAGN